MGSGNAILQVHPTRFCNLQCLHCYSESGPQVKEALPLPLLRDLIEDGAGEGYGVLGFSGGEPTLYPYLEEAARIGLDNGYKVTVTTNGTTLTPALAKALAASVHLVAVSLDGKPSSHNAMRNSPTAFQRMQSRLPLLRDAGIPFGFIFTLTQYNLDELPWVLDFAIEHGAKLLQIHPLEQSGRAQATLPSATPDDVELSYGIALLERMQARNAGRIHLQLDLVDKDSLRQLEVVPSRKTPLAANVNPLVAESNGWVTPGQHGLSHRLALGSLYENRLPQLKRIWLREKWRAFAGLQNRMQEEVRQDEFPYVNFHERLAAKSRSGSEAGVDVGA